MIRKYIRILRYQLLVFWLLPLFLAITFAMDWFETGKYTTDEGARYVAGTIAVLTTIIFVPLSLKTFSLVVHRRLPGLAPKQALREYRQWSGIRLGLLEAVVIIGIFVYFQTFENLGGLCALIGLTASFFCIPGEKKMRFELPNLPNEE